MMANHPTGKGRNKRKKLKARYSKLREDAQLHGLIETSPEGAVRCEVVDPASQDEQQIPSLDREAIRRGWAVPEEKKPQLVDRLMEPFFKDDTIITKEGQVMTVAPDRHLLKENFKALALADRMQWERDHPEEAGKAKGKTEVNVGVQVNNFDPWQLYQKALKEVVVDEIEEAIARVEAGSAGDAAPDAGLDNQPSRNGGSPHRAG
jgi:hypothetical protein